MADMLVKLFNVALSRTPTTYYIVTKGNNLVDSPVLGQLQKLFYLMAILLWDW